MANQGQKQNIIYVGGLDMAVTQNVLHQAFEPFGAIAEINMPKPDLPSNPDPHRGFAYMTFEEPSDAKEAIYNMNLAELHGRTLKVSVAKPLKKADEGLGSKTAIWEQEGYVAQQALEDEGAASASGPDPMQGLDQFDVAGPKAAADGT